MLCQVAIKVLRLNHDNKDQSPKLHKVNKSSTRNLTSRLTFSPEVAEGNRSLEKTKTQEYCAFIRYDCRLRLCWNGFALDGKREFDNISKEALNFVTVFTACKYPTLLGIA
jgi:hypothetical protein